MDKFQCNGIDWSVYVEGDGNPLVFLHGFPFDHTMYLSACRSLADSYRVIIPDLPGFGVSRFRDSYVPIRITMGDFADGLSELLNQLDVGKALVCGLSMGGYVAMQFFRRYPDQLSGLVFCDTRSTPDTATAAEKRLQLADSVFKTGVTPLAGQMIPNLLSPKTITENGELVSFLVEMISRQSSSGVAAAARGMAIRDDSTGFLKEINVPTLVLGGEDDKISPPDVMRELANQVSGAEYSVVSDSGHIPPLENPDCFTSLIRSFADRVFDAEGGLS